MAAGMLAAVAALAGLPSGSVPVALASSVTYTVTTTVDLPDANVGTARCADAAGHCSLRAAVMQANAHAGPDTIVLPAGTFRLTQAGVDDTAILGDLDITGSVAIKGAGATKTIVDGNGSITGDRVFHVLSTAGAVSFSNLTIRNGKDLTTGFEAGGGVLWSGGTSLSMSNVVVEHNSAKYGGGLGLALSAPGATVDLNHVTVRSNTSVISGGGLNVDLSANAASFRLRSSVVGANHSRDGGGIAIGGVVPSGPGTFDIAATEISGNTAEVGGALLNTGGTVTTPITVRDSYLHGNTASDRGGAIFATAYLAVHGSTLSNNVAAGKGGAVYENAGGIIELNDSTISANAASVAGGGVFAQEFLSSPASVFAVDSTFSHNTAPTGGAVAQDAAASVSLFNTLVQGGAGGTACSQPVASVHAAFADDASCGLGAGDNATILLSSLGLHGGRTPTLVPQPGSAGLDVAITVPAFPLDQRGIARPQGAGRDAGAVEVCPSKPAAPAPLRPLNGAVTSLRHVTLSWRPVPCVEGYTIVVRRTSTTGTLVEAVYHRQSTSLVTVLLSRGHTYYWRVTAVGDRGTTNGAWRHFRVK
jgi:CSLREA domain-containing protein